MIDRRDMYYVDRSKKLKELVATGMTRSDASRVVGINPSSAFDAFYTYDNHMNLYNDNFIYRKIADSDKITVKKRVAKRIAESVVRYWKDEESLLKELRKGRDITRKMGIGMYAYVVLTTLYEKELTDMD